MSVFSKIKDFLFGKKFITIGKETPQAVPATQAPPPNQPQPTPSASVPPIAPAAPQPTQSPETLDIEAILENEAAMFGEKLNWRTSIVDLMKLCGIDPSLDNRRELADELGFTGDKTDTAAMNIWLHKQVMQKLEESGGKVPASLKD